MNYNEFLTNEKVNKRLKANVLKYHTRYMEATDFKNQSTCRKYSGYIYECLTMASLVPSTSKTDVSPTGKIDLRYKNITFECKQGGSAFCSFDYETGYITSSASRGQFFCFAVDYKPSKKIENVAHFIPYYDLVEYLHQAKKIRLKQNTKMNNDVFRPMGIEKNFPYVELAPQFDRLTEKNIEELKSKAMTFEQFVKYADEREGFPYKAKDLNELFQKIIFEKLGK